MNFMAMGIRNRRTCNGKKNKESHQMPMNLYEHTHKTIENVWGNSQTKQYFFMNHSYQLLLTIATNSNNQGY